MRDLSELLSDAQNRRKANNRIPETELARSEYNSIIMLCYQFRQAFIESYQSQPLMELRRNRLFQTIAVLARQRKELPTLDEYFKGRSMGMFSESIAEVEALEYVGVIQDKIMEMNDWKVEIGKLDDEDFEEE